MSFATDADLLATDVVTRFAIADSGRLLFENDPVRSQAPRLYLAGCRGGNALCLRHDVAEGLAQSILRLAADEPAFTNPDLLPVHLGSYLQVLTSQDRVAGWDVGCIWTFPDGFAPEPEGNLVFSGTVEGDSLLARIAEQGMPAPLLAMGFSGSSDLWPPWCAAIDGDEIASIAFTARLGRTGAEAGVVTIPALRGRGYATATTAGWATLPALRHHVRFYSASKANVSSLRVAQRLGLRLLGASLTIA